MLALTVLDGLGAVICAEDHLDREQAKRRGLAFVLGHLGQMPMLRSCTVIRDEEEVFEMQVTAALSSARILIQTLGTDETLNQCFADLMQEVDS